VEIEISNLNRNYYETIMILCKQKAMPESVSEFLIGHSGLRQTKFQSGDTF